MLNNVTSQFCVGRAHCLDYAEAAIGGVLQKKVFLRILLYLRIKPEFF